jgi:hypothetical protein
VSHPHGHAHALVADRDHLEVEIVSLRNELDLATARLDALRSSGPEPRGFVAGVLAGLLLLIACFALFAYVVGSTLGHID